MAHIARLDRDLAAEISKEQALAKKLAFEQRKEQEMTKKLDKTKQALDLDESQIAADKVQLSNKVRGMSLSDGWTLYPYRVPVMYPEYIVPSINYLHDMTFWRIRKVSCW